MRFKLFNVVQILLFTSIFFYLTVKLTFGNKGIFEYYKLEERFTSNIKTLDFLKQENKKLTIKFGLLNEKNVNSLYLEEMARTSLQFGRELERLIILEK
jgi:cell division protein FtsB